MRWGNLVKIKTLLVLLLLVFFAILIIFTTQLSCEEDPREVGKTGLRLAIVVLTAPTQFSARALIRSTYLSDIPGNARVFFPLGTLALDSPTRRRLEEEDERTGDLLLLPHLREDYNQLTQKVLSTLVAIEKGFRVEFLLKLDADSFVRFDQTFFDALSSIADPMLYWGFLDGRASPKKGGKWEESSWVLCDHYLPYALGGGYLLGGDLVRFIATNARLLRLYQNEDVSVGTWLAGLKVKYVHEPRFDTEYKSRGCDNRFLIAHKQSSSDIRNKWHHLHSSGKLCEKEVRLRPSYTYDWSQPPSKCCKRTNDPSVP